MASAETIKPLADYAPRTYRRLNPRPLRRLTEELVALVGPDERSSDAKLLVAEFVVEQVRASTEHIRNISPENFAAAILAKAGVIPDEVDIECLTTSNFPVIKLEGAPHVLDFRKANGILPLEQWNA